MGFSVTAAGTLCRAGGRFREVYYWDSYFTMLGLAEAVTGIKSRIWWPILLMK